MTGNTHEKSEPAILQSTIKRIFGSNQKMLRNLMSVAIVLTLEFVPQVSSERV